MRGKVDELCALETKRNNCRELANWYVRQVLEPWTVFPKDQSKSNRKKKNQKGYEATALRPQFQLYNQAKSATAKVKENQLPSSSNNILVRRRRKQSNNIFNHNATPTEAIKAYTATFVYSRCRKKKINYEFLGADFTPLQNCADRQLTKEKVSFPCSKKITNISCNSIEQSDSKINNFYQKSKFPLMENTKKVTQSKQKVEMNIKNDKDQELKKLLMTIKNVKQNSGEQNRTSKKESGLSCSSSKPKCFDASKVLGCARVKTNKRKTRVEGGRWVPATVFEFSPITLAKHRTRQIKNNQTKNLKEHPLIKQSPSDISFKSNQNIIEINKMEEVSGKFS